MAGELLYFVHSDGMAAIPVSEGGAIRCVKRRDMAEQRGSGEIKIAITEGTALYTSEGNQWGTVEAVGARYITVARGLLGQETCHLPLALVARADADRVELTVPAGQIGRYVVTKPPADEPIYGASEPIADAERGAVGIPVDERETFGTGA
jgi:hypothetical protein